VQRIADADDETLMCGGITKRCDQPETAEFLFAASMPAHGHMFMGWLASRRRLMLSSDNTPATDLVSIQS
jgi:hypothetical protein